MKTSVYGSHYYGLELTNGQIIMLFADEVWITESGALQFQRKVPDSNGVQTTLAYAPQVWKSLWAASLLDGTAVAIDQTVEAKRQ